MFDFGTHSAMRWRAARLILLFLALAGGLGLFVPATAQPRDAAYNADLIRLSELLGAIHYLRELCETQDGQLWRNKMAELIKNEEPEEDQRQLMISHFNISYHRYQNAYSRCTEQAARDVNGFIAEGEALALRLANGSAP